MTTLIKPLPEAFPEFSWTISRYHEAIQLGLFSTEDRIELLYGKLIDTAPVTPANAHCVTTVAELLWDKFSTSYLIREEKPITLTNLASEPEPNIAVVARRSYAPAHPTAADTYLIVEVADLSLTVDQTLKAALYAEAGITEYWIINLPKRRVEVHLQPLPDERAYGSVNTYGEGATFSSPFAGEVVVAELLPGEAYN